MAQEQFELRPATPDEANLFFSTLDKDEDKRLGVVGHVRADFGSGKEFWHTWWPHNEDTLNTPAFKAELKEFADGLMQDGGPLKDLAAMEKYCAAHTEGVIDDNASGYIAESEHYRYCLRCTPLPGWYHVYIYIYDKRQQALSMNQEGEKMNQKQVVQIREQYPPGTRIRLGEMQDPYSPVPSGTLGTVDLVDDIGQLHMKWDNGRSLALIPGVDDFGIVEPQQEPQLDI